MSTMRDVDSTSLSIDSLHYGYLKLIKIEGQPR